MTEKAPWRREGGLLGRRAFVAGAAAGLATLAATGCAPSAGDGPAAGGEATELGETGPYEAEGEWRNAACWLNCGGARCVNKAYVVDGSVVYQKTDDIAADTPEDPQVRGCVRGRSLRHVVYAPNRIRYPMKRKGWSPENPNRELRGRDEWERISWDEALDYVAGQLKRAIDEAGNRSILLPHWADSYTPFYQMFNALGGKCKVYDTASTGTYTATHTILGLMFYDLNSSNDRTDLANCDTIVLQGCNPSWASPGNPSNYLLQAKENGAQFIMIGPSFNESAELLDARWITVRPGTDTAFMLGVAYAMLEADDPEGNPLIDWDCLNTYTVGFDADHMPADARTDENFKDYVLGKYDGTPKTPEWASPLCGASPEDIRWYAQEIGCQRNVALMHSYAFARCNDADDVPQLFMTLGLMGGHFGKPGNSTGEVYLHRAGNNGPALVGLGEGLFPALPDPVDDIIPAPDLYDAIMDGRYVFSGNAFADPASVEERPIDIRVIYHCWRNSLQTVMGTKRGIEAHRKVDFVVTQGYEFNLSAQYSDILLPIQTPWEKYAYYTYLTTTTRDHQLFPGKVIEPLWEAKSDVWVGEELLRRFDIDPASVFPVTEEQDYFARINGAFTTNAEGEQVPLVSITQDDLDRLGFEGTVQEGVIDYETLMAQGKFSVPRRAGDGLGYIAYQAFREDPENNPLPSKSGKFEIYCQVKADAINAMGRSTLKPYPTYRPALHGFEESFEDFEGGVKGPYPFQMYNPHYLRRAHSGFDNVASLREVWPNPVFVNASDAAAKGIADGDAIRIFNDAGECVRTASLTERLMPGCVALPHGTWLDLDEDGIDRSGSDNWMLAGHTSGCGVAGYNTNLVDYERWTSTDLPEDRERSFAPVGGVE